MTHCSILRAIFPRSYNTTFDDQHPGKGGPFHLGVRHEHTHISLENLLLEQTSNPTGKIKINKNEDGTFVYGCGGEMNRQTAFLTMTRRRGGGVGSLKPLCCWRTRRKGP